jgi:hypothetical protein
MIMEQFRVKKEGFKEIQKRVLITTLPIMLIAIIGGFIISYFTISNTEIYKNILPFIIPASLAPVGLGMYIGLKRQKAIYDSYILTINDDCIIREQINTTTIKLPFSEIKKITKSRQGDYSIFGTKSSNLILIPKQIENFEKIEGLLINISNISIIASKSILQKLILPLALLTVCSMIALYLSLNKPLIFLSGLWLTVVLTWSFINIQKSKNIDKRTKSLSYSNILILIIIISMTIFKLFKP